MLTRLLVRNFKRFGEVDIELGEAVVFIGPNNSGKTSALQALALWELSVRTFIAKRGDGEAPPRRPGVTINRKDLVALPVPDAGLLWRDLHFSQQQKENNGKRTTRKIPIELTVSGISSGIEWELGIELNYANDESLLCRPLSKDEGGTSTRMPVPPEAKDVRIAFLPPMSGLVANEIRLDPGAVQVRIGEGRTAEVLRNVCLQIAEAGFDEGRAWSDLAGRMRDLFGIELLRPQYVPERGEVTMAFKDQSGIRLDITAAGRGLQQTLLLLAYLLANPGSIILLDEPDAHLEILRQRQIYAHLVSAARKQGSQIIAATHSEVLLNEAADRDIVIAFVGKPHRIDDRGTQLTKSLKEIGFEHYYQAELTGWVLYLEGSTDLAILQAFARRLKHPAALHLERPFVHYVQNQPQQARHHFYGLREARSDLVGLALFDRLSVPLREGADLREVMWRRREIENYLCQPETLAAYAEQQAIAQSAGALFDSVYKSRLHDAMNRCVTRRVAPAPLEDPDDPWWSNMKATDDFLDVVVAEFYRSLQLPNLMRKTDYHILAEHVPLNLLNGEIREKLDAIVKVALEARPKT